jgi:hypothetical protein
MWENKQTSGSLAAETSGSLFCSSHIKYYIPIFCSSHIEKVNSLLFIYANICKFEKVEIYKYHAYMRLSSNRTWLSTDEIAWILNVII